MQVAVARKRVRLYTDGSSIGNPGAAGLAYIITDESGNTLAAGREPLGTATNNQAEYRALLRGLEAARRLGASEIEWFSDSELLVKQWQGTYKVKDATLRGLMQQARQLAQGLQVRPHAVPRNSLPEMAQVDHWARGVALGELDALVPKLPPSPREALPTEAPNRPKRRNSKPLQQLELFSGSGDAQKDNT